jgi:hypothetical protein
MAASKTISFNSNAGNSNACIELTFNLYPLRFRFVVAQPMHFVPGESANTLRGRLGNALFRDAPAAYQRLFAPSSSEGPSGFHDPPRPFVLRVAHLDGAHFNPGQVFEIGVNLFDMSEPAVAAVRDAVSAAVRARLTQISGDRPLRLPLAAPGRSVHRAKVRFVTPTELKGASQPEFSSLFSRIRDRVSTLRSLYGQGPLPIDFKAMGLRAEAVSMIRCDLKRVHAERVSRRTGQRHSLGGFTGLAEYEGDLTEFVPYLEAARWTGVGRQTVWGKGEIDWKEI